METESYRPSVTQYQRLNHLSDLREILYGGCLQNVVKQPGVS